jgi:tetratricopeptide (TPR) repeat protein
VFKDNLDAILYRIKTLKLLGEYQIALEIANDKMSLNNIDIFIQIISILIHFKRYDEALSLIDKSPFKDNPNIKNQKQSILLKKEGKVTPKSRSALNPPNKDAKKVSLNDLLDFIESKRLSIESICSLPISQLLKDIFIVAYYEVRDDQEQAYQYIGHMASSYENNDDCLKVVEELEKHFDSKKIPYSRLLYQKLLIISQSININNSRK